ncbi:MAG: hypothetical protein R2789_05800 [Microthrixaceae bacterium]
MFGTQRRLHFVVAVLVLAAVLPVWKLLGVVIGDGAGLVASGKAQGLQDQTIPALRGPILDRNGSELAISLPRVRVAANARELGRLAEADPCCRGPIRGDPGRAHRRRRG